MPGRVVAEDVDEPEMAALGDAGRELGPTGEDHVGSRGGR